MQISLKEKTVGIVGLGLIGGSLALRLQAAGLKVIGIVRNAKDFPPNDLSMLSEDLSVLQSCDVVFLCVPLNQIVKFMRDVQAYLKPGAVLTDVGSVKKFICEEAHSVMREDCIFVGGHPMAGTEKSGFGNAFPQLFEGRSWALIDSQKKSEGVNLLKQIIELAGAKIVESSAEEHDQAVSLISHLPLFLSISLLKTVEKYENEKVRNLALTLASSGFESMTRLAKGNPVLNADLLGFNSGKVLSAYESFLNESESLLRLIRSEA